MDLTTLADLAEVIGAIVVVGGFGFGVIQLQQFRLQRRARSAIEVARSLQDAEFARALRLVLSLPCGLDAKGLRERGTEYEDAAMLVSLTVESVGLIVQRRLVSLPMVWELMGGVLLGAFCAAGPRTPGGSRDATNSTSGCSGWPTRWSATRSAATRHRPFRGTRRGSLAAGTIA